MKCLIILMGGLLMQSFCIAQEVFKRQVTTIKGETYVEIVNSQQIEADSTIGQFEISSGSFNIDVSGLIDRSSGSKIFVSLFADINIKNDPVLFFKHSDTTILYRIEGIPAGVFTGLYSNDGHFTVNTRFKIVSSGHPTFYMVLPINLFVSPEGNVRYERSFISGNGQIYKYKPRKKK